jgi:hypothetical protein
MEQTLLLKLSRYLKYQIDKMNLHKKESSVFVRFKKKILNIMVSIASSKPDLQPCDVLFLHIDKSLVNRCDHLRRILLQKGLVVKDDYILSVSDALLNRYVYKSETNVSMEFVYVSSYARFIVTKYQPKVLITFMDSSVISSFLKYEMKPFGKVINIAHGVSNDTYSFSMIDFDYLFLFGKKSFEHLQRNELLFGSTKVVLTGSPYFEPGVLLSPNCEKNILFFSTWLPEADRELYLGNFTIIRNWAKTHSEYHLYVKLHPSPYENPCIWENLARGIDNITILDKAINIINALENVSLAIVAGCSTSSLEASKYNRPVVLVDKSDIDDNFLCIEKFFLPRSKSVEELNINILKIFGNYEYYLSKCSEYVNLHLEHVDDSVDYIANCIYSILKGNETFPFIELPEKTELLEDYLL